MNQDNEKFCEMNLGLGCHREKRARWRETNFQLFFGTAEIWQLFYLAAKMSK